MKIVFDDIAARDLEDIYLWIAKDSPKAAASVDDRIRAGIDLLSTFPLSGRPGIDDTRELIVSRLPYVVVYEVDHKLGRVLITAIVHMARDRSDLR